MIRVSPESTPNDTLVPYTTLFRSLAFKENCPDLRNTRVIDIIAELHSYNVAVDVCDPWVDAAQAKHEYGIDLLAEPEAGHYDAMIVAVGPHQFVSQGASGVRALGRSEERRVGKECVGTCRYRW